MRREDLPAPLVLPTQESWALGSPGFYLLFSEKGILWEVSGFTYILLAKVPTCRVADRVTVGHFQFSLALAVT